MFSPPQLQDILLQSGWAPIPCIYVFQKSKNKAHANHFTDETYKKHTTFTV